MIIVYQLGYVIIGIVFFLCNLQRMFQVGSRFIHVVFILVCKNIVSGTAKITVGTVRESLYKIVKGDGISLRCGLC